MSSRILAGLAVLIAAVVVVVLVVGSGGKSYVVKLTLPDADGLRQGSPVAIGGQDVGTISMTVHGGQVVVDMHLSKPQAPIGRDATVSVASVNLLGQKRLELTRGNINQVAPSGYMLPASQVSVTTDLDQVLDVLTPDVRARLGILLNEAGQAFTGRQADVSEMLQQMPADFTAGQELLNGISSDNHTLADLVQTSDGFVSQLASQRTQLVHAVNVFGEASASVAARRAQLAATLQKAPGTLVTMQHFLGELQNVTVPLRPAAQDITNTAPALSATLAQLDPFRKAADPTLVEATNVAPELTHLATGATPVIKHATPVVASLATFSQALAPVSAIVVGSADNLVAILQNWSRAIQFRDGLSHVFRGEATFTPQTITSMINQIQQAGFLGPLAAAVKKLKGSGALAALSAPSTRGSSISNARGTASGSKTATSATTPTATTTATGTTPAKPVPSLQGLLDYLLKP